ncbi:MAG: hypothetical protein NUV65_03485 [Candidatus Roizmanbacteria bacterium]|nr:hypothetical protein [Candidatus Roizmanbacteria bacterium]
MIQTTIKANKEQRQKMLNVLLKFGSREKSKAIIKCLQEIEGLYLSALVHLSKAYVLYQPTSVKYFKNNKATHFWSITASSLYDSGVMYVCGLLDKDKKINYKNLRKLISNVDQLKKKPGNTPILSKSIEPVYERLKAHRDTQLAHYEYSKGATHNWEDSIISMNLIHKYIVDFHVAFFDTDFILEKLREETADESFRVCGTIGILEIEKDVKEEVINFFEKVEAKIKW